MEREEIQVLGKRKRKKEDKGNEKRYMSQGKREDRRKMKDERKENRYISQGKREEIIIIIIIIIKDKKEGR